MALVRCTECGAGVSTSARSCPYCGYSASHEQCWSCEHYEADEAECIHTSEKGPYSTACPHYEPKDND
jgi:hypothetical protein